MSDSNFRKRQKTNFSRTTKMQSCVDMAMLHFTLSGVCFIIPNHSFNCGLQNVISSKKKFHLSYNVRKMSVYTYSIIIFCCSQCDILGRFYREYYFGGAIIPHYICSINHFLTNKLEKE